jgi:murein DD-endopeptidase MepM/ murein hydrolase activator NlpD
MSEKLRVNVRAMARIALLGAAAGLLAGCSSEVTRFGEMASADMTPTGSTGLTPQASVGHNIASAAPVRPQMANAPIQSAALPPPKATYSAPATPSPHLASAPVRSAPTTGAIAATGPAGGSWSIVGGTPIVIASGESLTTISTRYGVPGDVLLKANGLSASQVRPGARLVVPVYSNGRSAVASAPQRPQHVARVESRRPAKSAKRDKEPAHHAAAERKSEHSRRAEKPEKKSHEAKVARSESKEASKRHSRTEEAKASHSKPAEKAKTAHAEKPVRTAKAEPTAEHSRKSAIDPTPTGSVRATEVSTKHESDAAHPEFRWPARGRIIQGFKRGGNDGINIAVPDGTSVKAVESGVVAYAGNELKGYGNLILIRHPNGFVSAYANNSDLEVKRGDVVKRGQTIAKSGQSGNVSSPQLHFELRKGATPVDPTKYLAGL